MKFVSSSILRNTALFAVAFALSGVGRLGATTLFMDDILPSRRSEGSGGFAAGRGQRTPSVSLKGQASQTTPQSAAPQKPCESKAPGETKKNEPRTDSHPAHRT